MKILLGREDVDPNTASQDGQTPLSWAARNGDEEVVKMLLERNNPNINTMDNSGRTPASWAAEYMYDGIAKLLRDRVNFSSKYGANLQPAVPYSPELSELSEHPSKRVRRF